MRRLVNNVISVIFTAVKFCIMKLFHGRNFRFSLVERFSPNVVTEFNRGSDVELGRSIRIHSGSKLKVRKGAKLFIGAGTKINYNCMIVCHNSVSIGEGTEFGPAVYIYDHDHDYAVGLKADKFKSAPIVIGKNVWIGANTVILRGTVIGDNSVVGAGCVIKGEFPANSVIVQKRETEYTVCEVKA